MTDQPKKEPILNMPPVVQTLCLLNVGIFLLINFLPQVMTDDDVAALAFIPARYTDPQLFGIDAFISPITHMFLHANWLHLTVNMATLLAFGSGLEKNMGGARMLLFYFITGLCGAGLHFALEPHSPVPVIGASGAISGLFGGVIMMMYGAGMMGKGFRKMLPIIVVWIAVSIFFGYFGMPGENNPIAWDVHIGGFLAGMALYRPILKLKI